MELSYFAIIIGAIFVNNVVLAQFLGICPFLGVSSKVETSLGMGAAVTFVMAIAAVVAWLIQTYVLVPLDIVYMQTIVIILVIAIFFAGIRQNPVVDAAFKGMRPAVVALIIGPVLTLSRGMHWTMLVVIAASALAIWWLDWSPIWILAAAAALGIAWELTMAKKVKGKR